MCGHGLSMKEHVKTKFVCMCDRDAPDLHTVYLSSEKKSLDFKAVTQDLLCILNKIPVLHLIANT